MPNLNPRPPSTAGKGAARGGGWAAAGAAIGGALGPRVGLDPLLAGSVAAGALAALSGALGKVARDQVHEQGFSAPLWIRLAATLFVLPLLVTGCVSVTGENGRTWLVGQATLIESTATDGACGFYQNELTHDDGEKDEGKQTRSQRVRSATAPCRIVEGGSLSDNLRAMFGSVLGFLAGLSL